MITKLIFGRQYFREEVLSAIEGEVLHEEFDQSNGRLTLKVRTSKLTGFEYFIGADGVLHEMEYSGHIFPCGLTMHWIQPKAVAAATAHNDTNVVL